MKMLWTSRMRSYFVPFVIGMGFDDIRLDRLMS